MFCMFYKQEMHIAPANGFFHRMIWWLDYIPIFISCK